NTVGDHRHAAEAAADEDRVAEFTGLVLDDLHADVMYADRCAVTVRSRESDLELARQPVELGMEGRPLPRQFAVRPRIDEFIPGHAGEMIRGDVADAVA